MTERALKFSTIRAAVRAADGSAVPRVVEIDAQNTIRLVPIDPDRRAAYIPPLKPGDENPWDEVLTCGRS